MDRMPELNLKPEPIARETVDGLLRQSGWVVQSKNKIDFSAGPGIASRPASLRTRIQVLPALDPTGLRACRHLLQARCQSQRHLL